MAPSGPSWAGRRVTVLASFDSFLRAGAQYAAHYEALGATVRHQLVLARPRQVSASQLERFGLPQAVRTLSMAAASSFANLHDQDLVILALDGLRSRRFLVRMHRAFAGAPCRPLTLSVYPGLIFRFHLEGMSSRMAADVLALNSPADLDLYERALRGMGLENRNALCLGISFLPSIEHAPERTLPRNGDLLFVAQPTVPLGREERLYVVHRLVRLARAYPTHRVVLKPRHRRTETTLHRVDHHYEDLLTDLARTEEVPNNLLVVHEPMDSLLNRARLVMTFSSTASIEAIVRGIPTRIINDLGVHENIGNHFFLGSSLLASFDDVEPDLPVSVRHSWLSQHVVAAADRINVLDGRLLELFDEQAARETALPPPYPRLVGRSRAFEQFTERRNGWASIAELGRREPGGWRGRVRRTGLPLVGILKDALARTRGHR